MILIVTPNPLLEYRYYPGSVVLGEIHRAPSFAYQAGGKGFNISRQLKCLGVSSLNCTFIGGRQGKLFRDTLDAEALECVLIRSQAETRTGAVIVDEQRQQVTSFFSPNAEISKTEVSALLEKLEKMIPTCEMVVFAGSAPSADAEEVFVRGIELAHRYDKISVLDTYGNHLERCIEAAPTILHNNFKEIESSLGNRIEREQDALALLQLLFSHGVKQSFLTNGAEEFYAANHDFFYKIAPPEIDAYDATGSGDAFTAGIICGWHNDEVFDDMLRFATALGAQNAALESVCNIKPGDAESLSRTIALTPVGKKMKTIDVTPTT